VVREAHLLVGKVVGIGLVGLGRLAIAVAAGLLTNAAVHSAKIPGNVWVLMPASLAFCVAGFALAGPEVTVPARRRGEVSAPHGIPQRRSPTSSPWSAEPPSPTAMSARH